MRFLCVLEMYHVRPFIVEKMGFGTAPRQCGTCSKIDFCSFKMLYFPF